MSQNENNKEVLTEEAKATEGKKNDKAKKPSKPKKVEIKKPELCRRYAARVVTDVKIEQSPWWLLEV